jgi:3'(2'), 5'-bisphosphate nucleotidase
LTQDEKSALLALAEAAARKAGSALLEFYKKDVAVVTKGDGSPLTIADKTSHDIVSEMLAITGITVISEEGDSLHPGATHYWLVDPLDGTKDFLAANDEFTVNIGLIENSRPVLGAIYAPALDELFTGLVGKGAWQNRHGRRAACHTVARGTELRMAISRFHDSLDANKFARANDIHTQLPVGSALKFGRLAASVIDVYPRFVGTSEWDTAAGQAVLEGAGGSLLDWHTGEALCYGKSRRRNGPFIAFRAPYKKIDFIYPDFES